jgi:hypothetical protein
MHDLDRQQLEQHEQEGLHGEHASGELSEAQEMELASQFLEIASEEELEQFLGDLWNRAKTSAGAAYNSPLVQQQVIPALKTSGRYFLPVGIGLGVERLLPGMGPWAAAGTKMIADQVLKEELEGLSGEDREFEIARRYVRFAMEALQRALRVPPRVPPPAAAQIAITEAARTHAPGLVPFLTRLTGAEAANGNGDPTSGRWVRHGNAIVIELG